MSSKLSANSLIEDIKRLADYTKDFNVFCEQKYGNEIETDPDYREEIIYEIRFLPYCPLSLDFEIWVTRDGNCAVGVSKHGNLAMRLGTSCYSKDRFVGGSEPKCLAFEDILWLFNAVSEGRLRVKTCIVPFFGILSASICIPVEEEAEIPVSFDWIGRCSRHGKCLSYTPWQILESRA